MKTTNTIRTLLFIGLILLSCSCFAQLPGFDDAQNDAQPAPISSIVALGLIAGAFYGMRKLK